MAMRTECAGEPGRISAARVVDARAGEDGRVVRDNAVTDGLAGRITPARELGIEALTVTRATPTGESDLTSL